MVDVLTLPDGSKKVVVRTSTNLTTAEWEDYILKIRAWGSQWGIDFPEPNEITTTKTNQPLGEENE